MMEKSSSSDSSQAKLESIFPQTFLCLLECERIQVSREFSFVLLYEPHKFPEYLAKKKWPSGRAFIPDLARLEYALRLASEAPETEKRGFEGVITASEPEWYAARFRFDPAHQLLDFDWPLDAILASPADIHSPMPSTFLIYRAEGKAQFRQVDGNEALLIRSLQLGVPLGRVLERNRGPEFDAMTFHQWIESGLLCAIDWAPVQKFDSPSIPNPP